MAAATESGNPRPRLPGRAIRWLSSLPAGPPRRPILRDQPADALHLLPVPAAAIAPAPSLVEWPPGLRIVGLMLAPLIFAVHQVAVRAVTDRRLVVHPRLIAKVVLPVLALGLENGDRFILLGEVIGVDCLSGAMSSRK